MGTAAAHRETCVRLLSPRRCEILYDDRILAADFLTMWALRGQWLTEPSESNEHLRPRADGVVI